jgi:hypothetical protein
VPALVERLEAAGWTIVRIEDVRVFAIPPPAKPPVDSRRVVAHQ